MTLNKPHTKLALLTDYSDGEFTVSIPFIKGVNGYGSTFEEAYNDLLEALKCHTRAAEMEGINIFRSRDLKHLAELIKISKLANTANLNSDTIATKLKRGTKLTSTESNALHKVLIDML